MKLSDLAIKRPVTTVIMVLLVVLLGVIAFNRVQVDLLPNITLPVAVVITNYEGVGPEEIETMVTRPIESAVATVTNIKNLSSSSSTGNSLVMVEFNWGTDMDMATLDMREKIDLIEGYLPDGASKPIIVQFDPSMLPIMQLGVSSSQDLASLKKYLEDVVVPRLERLEGVAQVNLVGGRDREILITVDQTKLNNYYTSFSNISNALLMENLNLSGGHIRRGDTDLLVRVTGKFESIEEIENILIPTATGNVLLKDIAEVKDTYKEVTSISRLNGKESIGITIQKQADANTVMVSRRVNAELKKIMEESELDLEIVPIMDQAEYIELAIGNVGNNAIVGGLLAVLILLIFLKNIRSTIIIAVSIPVSIITTFLLMYFSNLTINLMTLGGLALGVGMLVDNSIVVLENIYRYRSEGYTRLEAASEGTKEVGMAITASTLTTIVVFLPVVFMGGITAEIFKELALTVTFSLLASLLVAITLIPVMSSRMLELEKEKKDVFFDRIKNLYKRSLRWALDHRGPVLAISIILLAASLALIPFIGAEFIPDMDQGMFYINIQLPLGTSLEETSRITARVEDIVLTIPEVEAIMASVGSSSELLSLGTSSSDISSVIVLLKDLNERDRSTWEVMEELRQKLRIPGAEISLQASDLVAIAGSPISIKVLGDNLEFLEEQALIIREELAQIEGIREIDDNISEGRPELQLKINRELAAGFGLRPAMIASTVRSAISGDVVTRYEVDGEEIDVRLRLDKEKLSSPEQLKNLYLPSPTGAMVPLERVAEFHLSTGAREILRENQVRYVNVTADLYNRNLSEVMPEIQARLQERLDLPPGYQLEYGGEFQEIIDAFTDLYYVLLLAVVLVYMVMAAQFESFLQPFIVIFSVPMAAIGVLFALFISGHNLSIVTLMGMIMLAGIVVNNAIVMVDYINTLRSRGSSVKEALEEAGPVRLRPILMTSLTTILGLVPMALGRGEGGELTAPLGIVVIAGLTVATFLTLYLIPIIYSLVDGLKSRLSRSA
ncbi:MAG: efflux RND transporter permease subunit [Halanaerobiales bacterium]